MKDVSVMRLRRLAPCLVLLTLLLTSCQPPELRDAQMLPDDSLITDNPCAAPCFRGITPGVTAWSEALPLIQDDPAFAGVEVVSGDDGAVGVQWGALGADGATNPTCCQMVSLTGEVVDFISIRLSPNLTVGQLIESKGNPAYVLGNEFSEDQAAMLLVYPDYQMVVYAFVAGPEGELTANSELVSAMYLQQEDMDLILISNNFDEWDGYKRYNEYMDGTFDVTASITATPVP